MTLEEVRFDVVREGVVVVRATHWPTGLFAESDEEPSAYQAQRVALERLQRLLEANDLPQG